MLLFSMDSVFWSIIPPGLGSSGRIVIARWPVKASRSPVKESDKNHSLSAVSDQKSETETETEYRVAAEREPQSSQAAGSRTSAH